MLFAVRPLIASFGNPYIPGKETLIGHFGINKLAAQSAREKVALMSSFLLTIFLISSYTIDNRSSVMIL